MRTVTYSCLQQYFLVLSEGTYYKDKALLDVNVTATITSQLGE